MGREGGRDGWMDRGKARKERERGRKREDGRKRDLKNNDKRYAIQIL